MEKVDEKKVERTKQLSGDQNLGSPEQTDMIDLSALNQQPEELNMELGHIYSHSICTKSQRIVLNTDNGFAIVHRGKVRKYYENGPFRGKEKGTGVRYSSLLGNRNLIALVPDANRNITLETQVKLSLEESSVYIYDINIDCIIYQRSFNHKITNLQLTQKYIIAGDSKRIIAINYLEERNHSLPLDDLFKLYQTKGSRLNVKYFETGCMCEVQNCMCGKMVSNMQEPRIIAFSYFNKKKIGILNTELDYHYDIETELYENFSLSEDGRYLGVAGLVSNLVQIWDLSTRKLFTEFKRGFQTKRSICMRFFKDWFGIVYESNRSATLHLFQMRAKQEKQVIYSKFKRYFNTYNLGVDLMVSQSEVIIVSLIGAQVKAIDVSLLNATHTDWKKAISPSQFRVWQEISKDDQLE